MCILQTRKTESPKGTRLTQEAVNSCSRDLNLVLSDTEACVHNHPNTTSQGGASHHRVRDEKPSLASEQMVRALILDGDGFGPNASHGCQRASLPPPAPPLPSTPLCPAPSLLASHADPPGP